MPEPGTQTLPAPSAAELAEILGQLEFFLEMEEAEVLPLEEDVGEEASDER